MFHLDPLTAYGICGVSALVGSAMLWLIRLDDKDLRITLRNCSWALMLLGVSLAHLLFTAPDPGWFAETLTLVGTAAAMPLLAAGMAALCGSRLIGTRAMVALAVPAVALQTVATLMPGMTAGIVYACLSLAGSALMVMACWPLLRRPRNFAEAALAASMVLYALTWVPRLVGALTWPGEPQPHHLYVPAAWHAAYGVMYAVLPLAEVVMLLSVAALRLHGQLKARATTDELTGLLMRRALHENALDALHASRRTGEALAVLLCDIDHFKRINDTQGHATGDEVLRHVARVMREHLRADALLARYGGEEFVVVLRAADIVVARQVADRLRLSVSHLPLQREGAAPLAVTMSVGVALIAAEDSLEQALNRADEALYRAKSAGRDRHFNAVAAAA
jgi:diguanylate cyclase (GGDEF)-like protein